MSKLSKKELSYALKLEDGIYARLGRKSPTTIWTNLLMGFVALVFVLAIVMFGYVGVKGTSMLPTLKSSGEGVIIFKYATIERGDMVVIDNSDLSLHGTDKLLIKRVIAIGGDTISYKADYSYGLRGKIVLKVNGIEIQENYIKSILYQDDIDNREKRVETGCVVPDGYVYVMGDNRLVSHDSRNFGCIPISRLIGEAILIIR